MNGLKIDVWDCRIRSLALWPDPMLGVPEHLPDSLLEIPEIVKAAEADIEAHGGAINMSGWYDGSRALADLIAQQRLSAS